MSAYISIGLDKPTGSMYFPGETLRGTVTVTLNQPTNCDFLNVVISGAADVEIIEERYGYGNSTMYGHRHYRNIYKADEQYMSQVINLLGRTTMPPGRLVYPFQCPLPMDNLPCTYQAQYGNINYQVSAHLGTFSEMDIREAVPILVGPMLDLNRISLIGYEPAEYTDAIEVGGGCCTRGKAIRLQISVPKRHFIPGEILRFTVVVDNKSNRVLNGTAMRLVLTVTCSAQGTDRRHETNVIAMAGPDIKANSVTVWEVNDFMVPTGLLPSFLGGCNIIRAEYSLQFNATGNEDSICADRMGLDACILLMIGTIPLNA